MGGNALCRLGFPASAPRGAGAFAVSVRTDLRTGRSQDRARSPLSECHGRDESITIALPDAVLDAIVERAAAQVAARLQPAAEPWVGVDAVAAHLACRRQRVYDLVCRRHVTGSRTARKAHACCSSSRRSTAGSRAEAPPERRPPSPRLRLVSVPTRRPTCRAKKSSHVKTSAPGVYRRGDGYVYTYRVRGRQRWGRAASFDEARRRKHQAEADTERGELRDTSRIKFGEYARDWVAGYQGRTSHGLRESTRTHVSRDARAASDPVLRRERAATARGDRAARREGVRALDGRAGRPATPGGG